MLSLNGVLRQLGGLCHYTSGWQGNPGPPNTPDSSSETPKSAIQVCSVPVPLLFHWALSYSASLAFCLSQVYHWSLLCSLWLLHPPSFLPDSLRKGRIPRAYSSPGLPPCSWWFPSSQRMTVASSFHCSSLCFQPPSFTLLSQLVSSWASLSINPGPSFSMTPGKLIGLSGP